MARGSIVKRCPVCKWKNLVKRSSECKHKEAVYVITYRIGKKQKWETVGHNKKEAERRLSEIISQINNGNYFKPTDILFKDFAFKWLEQYAKISVKPSTLRTYSMTVRYHLIPAFGDLPLQFITAERMQEFMAKSLDKCSPKTVNNMITQLKTIFKHARRWKYLRDNPALDIDHVQLEHKEMDFLSPEEIRLLLKHAQEPYKTLFLTAVLTGARRGELLGLQWGDVDWNSNTISVRRGLYWLTRKENKEEGVSRWRFISTKSKRSMRMIVMSPVLKEALEIHRLTCPVSQDDLVFCNDKGNPFDPDNMVKREFLPSLVAAGLRKIRFHDLRHTYTTLMIAQGENIKFIQSQLGHASIQTTLDRYGHLLPSNQEGVGARIDQHVFGHANALLTKHAQPSLNVSKQEQKEFVATPTIQ